MDFNKEMIDSLWGVPVGRIKELIDLFEEAGYNLKDKDQFEFIKRDYFKKVKNGSRNKRKIRWDNQVA